MGGKGYITAIVCDKGGYHSYDLTIMHYRPTLFPIIKNEGHQTTILIYFKDLPVIMNNEEVYEGPINSYFSGGGPNSIGCTKLIYKFNNFIELNDIPVKHNIKQITFTSGAAFSSTRIFEMNIDSNRRTFYCHKKYGEKPEIGKTIVDTSSFNRIIGMLNYLDFPSLNSQYSEGPVTDLPTANLTILYDNGLVKKISDYGDCGTYGLSALYDELFGLVDTQKWKKIHKWPFNKT